MKHPRTPIRLSGRPARLGRLARLLLLVLAAATATAAIAQDVASLRLVHALPDAGEASLAVDGAVVATAGYATSSEGFAIVPAGDRALELQVDATIVAVPTTELRPAFRYLVVLHADPDGRPAATVLNGFNGRLPAMEAPARLVNLVPGTGPVRIYFADGCVDAGAVAFGLIAAPYATAREYIRFSEKIWTGAITVCSDGERLAGDPTRRIDEHAFRVGHVRAYYLVTTAAGVELLVVDETP